MKEKSFITLIPGLVQSCSWPRRRWRRCRLASWFRTWGRWTCRGVSEKLFVEKMGKSEKISYAIDQEDGPSRNHCITPHWKEKPWLYLSELNNICFIHPLALKQFLKQTWSLWFPFWVVVKTQKVCHVTQHIYNQHYDSKTSQMTHAMLYPWTSFS